MNLGPAKGCAQPRRPDAGSTAGAEERSGAILEPADPSAIDTAAPSKAGPVEAVAPSNAPPVETTAATDTPPIDPGPPAETARVNLRAIANAYGDYTLKSYDEAAAFVEKLTGARSLDKAAAVQADFAKQACEAFVAESQKISELHKELTRQMFKPLESPVTQATRTQRGG